MMPFNFAPAAAALAGGVGPSMNRPIFVEFSTHFGLVAAAVGVGIVLAGLALRVIRRSSKAKGEITSAAAYAKVTPKVAALA